MQWSQTKPSTELILGEQWQEVILSQNEYETASWSFSKITFWLRYILTSLREQQEQSCLKACFHQVSLYKLYLILTWMSFAKPAKPTRE